MNMTTQAEDLEDLEMPLKLARVRKELRKLGKRWKLKVDLDQIDVLEKEFLIFKEKHDILLDELTTQVEDPEMPGLAWVCKELREMAKTWRAELDEIRVLKKKFLILKEQYDILLHEMKQ